MRMRNAARATRAYLSDSAVPSRRDVRRPVLTLMETLSPIIEPQQPRMACTGSRGRNAILRSKRWDNKDERGSFSWCESGDPGAPDVCDGNPKEAGWFSTACANGRRGRRHAGMRRDMAFCARRLSDRQQVSTWVFSSRFTRSLSRRRYRVRCSRARLLR